MEELLTELVKTAISAEIEAQPERVPDIFISEVKPTREIEPVVESEPSDPKEAEITAEEKTETVPMPASKQPKSGDRTVIDGKPYISIPGIGWIVDEGDGSVGTTVGNPGDKLTGNMVGIMGSGMTVHGKADINKQVARP